MNYVVDKVKEEQKEDVSILTHPPGVRLLLDRKKGFGVRHPLPSEGLGEALCWIKKGSLSSSTDP